MKSDLLKLSFLIIIIFLIISLFLGSLYLYNSCILILYEVHSILVFPIIFDFTRLIFSFIVIFISFNVLIFSKVYIKDEVFYKRFYYLVLLFIVRINILIFFPHIVTLLLG